MPEQVVIATDIGIVGRQGLFSVGLNDAQGVNAVQFCFPRWYALISAMMMNLVSLSGVTSCVIGGVVHIIAWSKGKEASQLESVQEIDKLSGDAIVLSGCS